MNKKAFIMLTIVILFSLIIYKIVINVITDAFDDANKRGIDLYVSSIKYSYTAYIYKNGNPPNSISDLDIKVMTKVECEQEKIIEGGKIELHGCTVEDSKTKYSYINGKVEKE